MNTNQRKVNVVTSARPTLINITSLHFLQLILPPRSAYILVPPPFNPAFKLCVIKPIFIMPIHEIKNLSDFLEKILNSQDLVVLDCFAEWCGPCKAIAPVIEQWSNENPHIKFYKVDVDKADDVAQELNVRAMPTFMFFKGGEKVTEVVGADQMQVANGIKLLTA
ncbi:Thioredoxin [Penicillium frequentans]|uniref:Thioredoxin n=1 Tax=Penicillium frequentans TaxID=3151616 RepID=A0AAD6CMY5_9EURO|nr:Thioredoxin [Penicillium glabrum]